MQTICIPHCKHWACHVHLGLISNLMHKILIYLHIIHLLKSSTFFEHCPARLQEDFVVIVYMQPLVSSLAAGDCLVHRLRKSSFPTCLLLSWMRWKAYIQYSPLHVSAVDRHLHRITHIISKVQPTRCNVF